MLPHFLYDRTSMEQSSSDRAQGSTRTFDRLPRGERAAGSSKPRVLSTSSRRKPTTNRRRSRPKARPLSQRAVRAHATRDRILDAAEKLFASRGYHGVSMRDITVEAGVPLALSTYHFGTKHQLYGQVVERRGVTHAAQMQRYLRDALAET